MREAEAAFGDPTVYLEQAVVEPRHIEVQILADNAGHVIHLFDRDCSVQRRHQKVVELAPAPNLDPGLRQRICADAVAFARSIGYVNAGTVEFLVDQAGRHVFIEMNPRIQVEHTVTEEVTDIDLVQAQLRIAAGETLADLGLSQDAVTLRGFALQCRITTEDPANGFRPGTGRITTYRSPGGAGVRLDGSTALGAEIEAHFDSLLVKLTCRGRDLPTAIRRARRALAEFRIRGVPTNIAFLRAVLDDPDFQAGRVTTSFIEDHPGLLAPRAPADRGTKLLTYLADVTVNRPHGNPPAADRPRGEASRCRPRLPAARRVTAAAAGPRPGGVRPRASPPGGAGGHRHHVPRRAPVAAGHPRAQQGPADGRRARRPHASRSCCRWKPGAAPPTTSRCATCTRTRGSGWPRSGRRCPTSACRCCCAAATPSGTRRTRKR